MAIQTNSSLDESERRFNEDIWKKREEEYFEVKNIAFVLVDLVPYEKREDMISSFEKIFSDPSVLYQSESIRERIGEINESGLFGRTVRLGEIINFINRKFENGQQYKEPIRSRNYFRIPDLKYADLPNCIDRIEITVRQDVNFCYYIDYFCRINKNYWNKNIKFNYIHTQDMIPTDYLDKLSASYPRGPEYDLEMQSYENEAAQYLSGFSHGLFLNEKYYLGMPVPSIRLISVPSFDFTNIKNWVDKHWIFLRYLKLDSYSFSVTPVRIYASQMDRIFKMSNIPKGVTIIYSEETVPIKAGENKYERMLGDASVFANSIVDYFVPLYWSNSNIFVTLDMWSKTIDERMAQRNSVNSFQDLEQEVMKTVDLYSAFSDYSLKELINLRTSQEVFSLKKNLVGPPAFTIHLYKINLFQDIWKLIESSFKRERTLIADKQKQISVLTSYYRDRANLKLSFTNFLLQNRIKWLTVAVSVAGIIVSVAVSLLRS